MSEFEKGTRVRFIEDLSMGDFSTYFPAKGTEGTAEDSFCEYGDYHGVTVLFDDGKHIDVAESYLEHVEDPYEYNVERTSLEHGSSYLQFDRWLDRETAADQYFGYCEAEDIHEEEAGFRFATYKLVKRRKAGPVEDA